VVTNIHSFVLLWNTGFRVRSPAPWLSLKITTTSCVPKVFFRNNFRLTTSFATSDIAMYSASVVQIITVRCFQDKHKCKACEWSSVVDVWSPIGIRIAKKILASLFECESSFCTCLEISEDPLCCCPMLLSKVTVKLA